GRLVGIAGVGFAPARVSEFSVELEERKHPLVLAFADPGAAHFAVGGGDPYKHPATPFGATSFMAFPLPLAYDRVGARVGLLLTSPVAKGTLDDVRWLADTLGRRLVRTLALRTFSDAGRRLARERALLHQIVNAVSDPILLTDTEGRLIVANARAETLFAST